LGGGFRGWGRCWPAADRLCLGPGAAPKLGLRLRAGQAMANGLGHNTSDCSVGSGVLYGGTTPIHPQQPSPAPSPITLGSPMTGQSAMKGSGADSGPEIDSRAVIY